MRKLIQKNNMQTAGENHRELSMVLYCRKVAGFSHGLARRAALLALHPVRTTTIIGVTFLVQATRPADLIVVDQEGLFGRRRIPPRLFTRLKVGFAAADPSRGTSGQRFLAASFLRATCKDSVS